MNLVEFEQPNLDIDFERWGVIGEGNATCGDDWDTLLYDKTKWSMLAYDIGCLYKGRSYSMARFASLKERTRIVHVIGAHFPQTLSDPDAYESAISVIRSKLKPDEFVVFMADTNTEGPAAAAKEPSHHGWNRTNTQIFEDLGVKGKPRAAPLFSGCCQNDNYQWQGDRLMTNFGKVAEYQILFQEPPKWANCSDSEFHKGISLKINSTTT